MRYVIIGASAAGAEAACELRKIDVTADISVISDETKGPYSRCLLPKFVDGRLNEDRLYFKTRHFFNDYGLKARLGETVVSIDKKAKEVILVSHEALAYDKLLIATGSRPFMPKIDGLELKGVWPLYSLQDAVSILEQAKDAAGACVVGAGFIGLEAAYALAKLGLRVTVVERCSQILPNQFDKTASEILKKDLEAIGVEVILNEGISAIHGDEKVKGVSIGKKFYIDCQLVIMATGVRANSELAKDASLKIDRGIVVDEYLQTTDPAIFAAGDVIEIDDIVTGKRAPSATWPNAVLQGRFAARNMAGGGRRYNGSIGIQNAVQFHEVPAIAYGITLASCEDETGYDIMRLHIKERKVYKKLVIKEGGLVGMIFVGDIAKAGFYASLIRNKVDIDPVRTRLLDSDFTSAYFRDEELVEEASEKKNFWLPKV